MPATLADLSIEDVKISGGPPVVHGCRVTILYRMALTKDGLAGECIESTYAPDLPIQIEVTPEALLKGVYDGIVGMHTGGSVRRLALPARLAYGDRGYGPILPKSDVFVEICAIELVHSGP